jgi:hypothetical protein
MSIEALETEPGAGRPAAKDPNVEVPAAGEPPAGPSDVEAEAAGEPPAEARALMDRLTAEMARARKAPVEKSMDQNRGAFEEWLKRINQGTDT